MWATGARVMRQLKELPPVVLMVVALLTAFGVFGTTVTVDGLSSNKTKTITITTTVTMPAPTSNGEASPPAVSGWLSEISNPSNNNFEEVKSHSVKVDGRTYANTVQLVNPNNICTSTAAPSTVSFPVPTGATYLSGVFGWTSESNGSSADLTVYKNGVPGNVLWSEPFPNPGLPLIQKRLNVAGAHTVTFELAGEQCSSGTFVLAEAHFTS